MCVGGRLDVVFLVPASRDRSGLVGPVLSLLASSAGSFTSIGPRDSQVQFFWYYLHVVFQLFFKIHFMAPKNIAVRVPSSDRVHESLSLSV